MKRLIAAIAVVLASGCSPTPGPIEIYGFTNLALDSNGQCFADSEPKQLLLNGAFDVSSGIGYSVGVLMRGGDSLPLKAITRSDGFDLASDKRDAYILESLELSYKATPSIGSLKSDSIPLFGEAGPVVVAPLLTEKNAETFKAINVSADPADAVRLFVTVEFKGRMSKSRTPFTSGQAVFPVTLTRRGSCTDGCVVAKCGGATGACCAAPGTAIDTANNCVAP